MLLILVVITQYNLFASGEAAIRLLTIDGPTKIVTYVTTMDYEENNGDWILMLFVLHMQHCPVRQ